MKPPFGHARPLRVLSLCIHGVGQSRVMNGRVINALLEHPRERGAKSIAHEEEHITTYEGVPVMLLSRGIKPPHAGSRLFSTVRGMIEESYGPDAVRATSNDLRKADVILSYVDERVLSNHKREDLLKEFQRAKTDGRLVLGYDVEGWPRTKVREFIAERAKRIK